MRLQPPRFLFRDNHVAALCVAAGAICRSRQLGWVGLSSPLPVWKGETHCLRLRLGADEYAGCASHAQESLGPTKRGTPFSHSEAPSSTLRFENAILAASLSVSPTRWNLAMTQPGSPLEEGSRNREKRNGRDNEQQQRPRRMRVGCHAWMDNWTLICVGRGQCPGQGVPLG